jgi:hypothetical protein
MKTPLHLLVFFLLSFAAKSQETFYKFFPGFETPFITSSFSTSDGIIWCLSNQNSSTLEITRRIVKTDFNGNTSWVLAPDSSNFSIQYACEPQPGILILGGTYTIQGQFGPQGYGLICRVDSDGNVLWSRKSTSQSFAGLTGVYSNGSIIYALLTSYSIFSGTQMYSSAIIAYDLDGNVLWEKPYGHQGLVTNYYFQGATVGENGDLIAAIDVRGSQNVQVSGIVLTRINAQGVAAWTKHINWHSDFPQSAVNGLAEGPDGSIYVGCRLMTDQSSIYPNALWIGKYDESGTLLNQKMYSAGTDVGENIGGMLAGTNELLVYVKRYSPFESIRRHLDLLAINYDDLTIDAAGSTDIEVIFESVYGEDPPQMAEGPDGSIFTSCISFCAANQKSYTSMVKWDINQQTLCSSVDVSAIYTDSVSAFTSSDYANSGFIVPSYSNADDISFISLSSEQASNFCAGCDISTGIESLKPEDSLLIYPNPASTFIRFLNYSGSFVICDLSGRVHLQGNTGADEQISIEGMQSGLYIIRCGEKNTRLIIAGE